MKYKFLFFLIAFSFLIVLPNAAAIGISPSKIEFSFKPNLVKSYDFTVSGISQGIDLEVYVIDDEQLKNIVTLSTIQGTGSKRTFTATITLPSSSKGLKPGKHRILIGAREKPKEGEGMAALTAVQTPIDIIIPYPGPYIEVKINTEDIELNSIKHLTADITNLGTESASINPIIQIYQQNQVIYNKNFNTVSVAAGKTKKITTEWNSSGYKEGTYIAKVIASYNGKSAEDSEPFKIGSILIEIKNYTSQVYTDSLNKFDIVLQSKWNSIINNAYCEISLKSAGTELTSFRTETFDIGPWQEKTVRGYFDAEGIAVGMYDVTITAHHGEQENSISGTLEIAEKKLNIMLWVIVGIVIILIIIIIIFWLKRKRQKPEAIKAIKQKPKKKKKR